MKTDITWDATWYVAHPDNTLSAPMVSYAKAEAYAIKSAVTNPGTEYKVPQAKEIFYVDGVTRIKYDDE